MLWCHAVFYWEVPRRLHRLRAGKVGGSDGFLMQTADCQESKPLEDGVLAGSNFGISMIILSNASLIAVSTE